MLIRYPCNATGDDEDRYTLEVKFIAMKYGDLLNAFEFPLMVYIVLFAVVSFLTMVFGMIFYFVHRLITRIKNPPKFRFGSMLRVVVPSAFMGTLLGLVPHVLGWVLIFCQFTVYPDDYDPTTERSVWQLDSVAGLYVSLVVGSSFFFFFFFAPLCVAWVVLFPLLQLSRARSE
jgi:hypothetical protein